MGLGIFWSQEKYSTKLCWVLVTKRKSAHTFYMTVVARLRSVDEDEGIVGDGTTVSLKSVVSPSSIDLRRPLLMF